MDALRKLALLALVLGAAASSLGLLAQGLRAPLPALGRDEVSLYEKRFEELRRVLPRRGSVGYLADREADDIRFDPSAVDYYLTQYALAPVVVLYSQQPELVVGNFRDPSSLPDVVRRKGLVVRKDFGDGVLLLARTP
jgi:hypothetical protein